MLPYWQNVKQGIVTCHGIILGQDNCQQAKTGKSAW